MMMHAASPAFLADATSSIELDPGNKDNESFPHSPSRLKFLSLVHLSVKEGMDEVD